MDKQLEGSFRKAIGFLEEEGYRYAIIGGIAVAQWGFPRATNDVDLKVLVPDTDYAVIREALRLKFSHRARPNAPENPLIIAVNKFWPNISRSSIKSRSYLITLNWELHDRADLGRQIQRR